jgi:adenine-specific DNA-methyltransferase
VKFDTPKPPKLLKQMLKLSCDGISESIALDFFSGSGTLGQAVYELLNEKDIKTTFILVQLPEATENKAFTTIADIGKERIRRTGQKIRRERSGQLNFESESNIDLGFKVLKLNQSNFKQWQAPDKSATDEALLKQIALGLDHIDPNASQEDLLYELLIKAGVMPTEKIEPLEWAGHKIFSVAEGSLLVYLELAIDQALIDAVLAKAPSQFICLDIAFQGNDQLKTNAVKTFATFNSDKQGIDRIEFTTV